MSDDTVASYAQGHLLAAHAGVAMFRSAASRHRGSPWGPELRALAEEVAEDRDSLEGILRRLGRDPGSVPQQAVRFVLGGAGHASRALHWWDALATVSELEKLRNGVAAKTVGWEVLIAAAVHDDRLVGVELAHLLARADDQMSRLRTIHLQLTQELVSPGGSPPSG
jgi:hypothetical protein